MAGFLSGIYFAFAVVAAVFFLRFWRQSGDALFARFSLALIILGAERIVLIAVPVQHESSSLVYLLRLLAFSLIIWAMVVKNRVKEPG